MKLPMERCERTSHIGRLTCRSGICRSDAGAAGIIHGGGLMNFPAGGSMGIDIDSVTMHDLHVLRQDFGKCLREIPVRIAGILVP